MQCSDPRNWSLASRCFEISLTRKITFNQSNQKVLAFGETDSGGLAPAKSRRCPSIMYYPLISKAAGLQ
jgi:hypothetical protein